MDNIVSSLDKYVDLWIGIAVASKRLRNKLNIHFKYN